MTDASEALVIPDVPDAIVAYWFAYLAYVGWRAAATGNYVLYGVCAALAVAFIAFNWRRRRG